MRLMNMHGRRIERGEKKETAGSFAYALETLGHQLAPAISQFLSYSLPA